MDGHIEPEASKHFLCSDDVQGFFKKFTALNWRIKAITCNNKKTQACWTHSPLACLCFDYSLSQ